jgi:hypothetical protein
MTKIKVLPRAEMLLGMNFEPSTRTVKVQYRHPSQPDTICQLETSLEAISQLVDVAVEMLHKLTGDDKFYERFRQIDETDKRKRSLS